MLTRSSNGICVSTFIFGCLPVPTRIDLRSPRLLCVRKLRDPAKGGWLARCLKNKKEQSSYMIEQSIISYTIIIRRDLYDDIRYDVPSCARYMPKFMKKSRVVCHLMSHPTFSNQLLKHVASNLSYRLLRALQGKVIKVKHWKVLKK